MSPDQNIKKAIAEIEMAEAHGAEMAKHYYRAKVRLENLHSPAAPKRGSSLSKGQVAHVIGKRMKNINQKR